MGVMRLTRTSTGLAALLTACAIKASAQDGPEPRPGPAADPVAAGAYLAAAGGCGSCHDAPDGRPFAGGLDLQTPFGILRAPNITPDPETGIGTWTRDDFARALHDGVRKGGAPLYPAMPYTHYTKVEDADIDALWAYVRSQEPVSNAVVADDLPFPYDVRDGMIGWKALFFRPGRFEPDPAASPQVNRGAYLVEALAHCSACHTPYSALGVELSDRAFQGGEVAPWYAPNISNDAGGVLGDYTVESLAAYLSTGDDGQNRRPVGPMAEVVFENLSRLTPEDIRAMAVYLKTREARPAPAAPPPFTMSAEARATAAALYATNCASCHGADGAGRAGVAARLAATGAIADGPPDNAIATMLQGVPARADWGEMPSFAAVLTDDQIALVANHLRSGWGNAATVAATPEMVVRARALVEKPARSLGSSALCPAVPSERMDEATRAALGALGSAPPSAETLAPIVAAYDAAFPDLPSSQRHLALIGAHCADLVAAGADREAVARAQIAFVSALGMIPRKP